MKWRVEIRPEVELDVAEAASWYARREPGLGESSALLGGQGSG